MDRNFDTLLVNKACVTLGKMLDFAVHSLRQNADAFFALFNGIVEVIGRFTIPLLMTKFLGMAEDGIWVSTGIVWILSGSTAWFRLFCRQERVPAVE